MRCLHPGLHLRLDSRSNEVPEDKKEFIEKTRIILRISPALWSKWSGVAESNPTLHPRMRTSCLSLGFV
jgi:hypothetical protein